MSDLHTVVTAEAIETIEQWVARDFERRLHSATTRPERAAVCTAAVAGICALNETMLSAEARAAGLMVEQAIDDVIGVVRDEPVLTFPDDAVVALEMYAQQIAVILRAAETPGERLAAATAVAARRDAGTTRRPSTRGSVTRPCRTRRHSVDGLICSSRAASVTW